MEGGETAWLYQMVPERSGGQEVGGLPSRS